MAILSILLTAVIVVASVLLVLIVLIQRPKQEGLGAAFGGGALDSALGAHTTDVLQKFTTYLGIAFFVSAIGLAMVKTRQFRAAAADNLLEGVEARSAELPELPPEITNLPSLDGLSGELPKPAAEEATPAATPEATPAAEQPQPAAETPAPEAKPATEAAKPAAEEAKPAAEPATPAAETPAPAPEAKPQEQ